MVNFDFFCGNFIYFFENVFCFLPSPALPPPLNLALAPGSVLSQAINGHRDAINLVNYHSTLLIRGSAYCQTTHLSDSPLVRRIPLVRQPTCQTAP